MTSEAVNAKHHGDQHTPPLSAKQFYESIKAAIIMDDLKKVQSLLQRWQSDASSPGPTLRNLQLLFGEALRHDRPVIFGYLFNQGGTTDPADRDSALEYRDYQDHGWNINGKHRISGQTMLSILLYHKPILRWYLAHGADPNISNRDGFYPLDQAVMWAPLDTVQLLLAYGATTKHRQILYFATRRSTDRIAVLQCLLDQIHKSGIHAIAPDSPRPSKVQPLCQNGTALHSATKGKNTENTEFLLMRRT